MIVFIPNQRTEFLSYQIKDICVILSLSPLLPKLLYTFHIYHENI